MATAKYKFGELRTVEYTPSGADLAVDTIVAIGGGTSKDGHKARLGVAMKAVSDGVTAEGAVAVSGVFEFPKVSAAVIAAGEGCDWIAASSSLDDNLATGAAGNIADFGTAMQDGANGETTILIDIADPGIYDEA